MRLSMIRQKVAGRGKELWEKCVAAKEVVKRAMHAYWKTYLVILGVVMVVSILWGVPRFQVKSYRAHLPSDAVSKLTPSERIQLEKDLIQAENNARVTLAQILGGLGLLTGLYLTWRNIRVAEDGKITDRYSKAIELLGSERIDVRIGGIYALERISWDSEKDHWPVMEVLTAFIRDHSSGNAGRRVAEQGENKKAPEESPRIGADIQAALTIIGRRRWVDQEKGKDQELDLVFADVRGGFLKGVDFSRAKLFRANLANAFLVKANLNGAFLNEANLKGAFLSGANMDGAFLYRANLTEARGLTWKQIQGAYIDEKTQLPPDVEAKRKEAQSRSEANARTSQS